MRLISFVACHRLPERSFSWRGRQMPICSRCTGILLGYCSYLAYLVGWLEAAWLTAVLLQIPALVDGGTQAAGVRTSTNHLRFVTGVMAGVGQVEVIVLVGTALAVWIRQVLA